MRPNLTPMSRRRFLVATLVVGAAACTGNGDASRAREATTTTARSLPIPDLDGPPFTLGVASGDPLPDAVVLWTRLAPDPLAGGGMPEVDVPVHWELAEDEDFDRVVDQGDLVATPELGHSVHVDVTGLDPSTTYWYRFEVGDHASLVGRTRTAPPADSSPERVALAVASCQAWHTGYYAAHRDMAEADLDAVVFMGDYIYELQGGPGIRPHELDIPTDVLGFRQRYGLYKGDPDLQANHAAHPWIVTWDDHEVEDNYAGLIPAESNAPNPDEYAEHLAAFPALRAAGYQVFYEHLPLRVTPPVDGGMQIYRSFSFGDLLDLWMLDTRQYRTEPPDGPSALARPFGGGPREPRAFDPDATMLGDEQEAWLFEGLSSSDARWQGIGTSVVLTEINRSPQLPEGAYSTDGWDGYVVPRDRLLGHIAEEGLDAVSVTGDIHTSCVADLHADFEDPDSPVVATEFVATSVSSLELLSEEQAAGARSNPHIHLYDTQHRGWVHAEVTPEAWTAQYRWVDDAFEPDSGVAPASTWVVEPGRPGAQPS